MGAEKHLNTAYKHFCHFILHFNLVDVKELTPTSELIDTLTNSVYQVTKRTGGSGAMEDDKKKKEIQAGKEQQEQP